MAEPNRTGALSSVRALAFLELVQEIAVDSNSPAPAHEVMKRALGAMAQATNAAVGHVYWRDRERDAMVPSPIWFPARGTHVALRRATREATFARGRGLPGRILELGEPVAVPRIADDPDFRRRAVCLAGGLQAAFGFPVLVGPDTDAVLELFYEYPHDPDWLLLDVVAAIGTLLGRAVERERATSVQRGAEVELRRREQQLLEAHRIARLGTWDWDIRSNRITWSDLLYEMYGIDPTGFEASYEAYMERIHPDDRERMKNTIAQALEAGDGYSVVHRLVRPDGAVRIVHGRGTVFGDEGGKPVRMAGTAQDITEQIEAERRKIELEREQERSRDLLEVTEALERSNQELDQFAYAVSHDLKAPLRGVKNLTSWLVEDLGERLDDGSRDHLRLLGSRVERMGAYIDGILEYSRAGRAGSEPETVAVAELMANVIDLLGPGPDSRVTVPADLPTLETERYPLQQVFQNLVANALRHGGPAVQVTIEWEDAAPDPVFCVCDDGPGIPADQRERIFEVFATLKPRDRVEGAGIGLAVVKKIIERRGGRIWVDSELGAGAAFSFTWPPRRRDRAASIG